MSSFQLLAITLAGVVAPSFAQTTKRFTDSRRESCSLYIQAYCDSIADTTVRAH